MVVKKMKTAVNDNDFPYQVDIVVDMDYDFTNIITWLTNNNIGLKEWVYLGTKVEFINEMIPTTVVLMLAFSNYADAIFFKLTWN